jgi:ATP:ADP antiporter, AAA family
MAILATPFFALIVLYARGPDITSEHLASIVWFGAIMSLFSRASKNAFFDPTTQMAYIPLDQVLKNFRPNGSK